METITRAPEYILWSWTTIALCTAGWASHWLMSWGKRWKRERLRLVAFVSDNPPAFWLSVVATLAFYVIGPQILPFLGVDISSIPKDTASVLANFGAFFLGLSSDWFVYGFATMLKRVTGTEDPQQ